MSSNSITTIKNKKKKTKALRLKWLKVLWKSTKLQKNKRSDNDKIIMFFSFFFSIREMNVIQKVRIKSHNNENKAVKFIWEEFWIMESLWNK